mgnify:CR=1 FL=1
MLKNKEKVQEANSSQMIFSIDRIIENISNYFSLNIGDLIFTGTPGGVGAGMKPMQFLKPGDRVRVEIEGLGAIENICEPEA